MDLEQLKKDFSHKAEVDVKDIDVAIKAVPFLVKEVIKLEEELKAKNSLIEKLKKKVKKEPPKVLTGQRKGFAWLIKVDEESNILLFQFSGIADKGGAKICSNAIINMLDHLEPGFSVISDFRKLETSAISPRIIFYFRKVHYLFSRMNAKFVIRVVKDAKDEDPGFIDIPASGKELKVFTVTSIEEGKNIVKNLGRHLRK